MEQEHWLFLLMLALGLGLMAAFSLARRPRSLLCRWAGRLFWAWVFAEGGAALQLLGANPLNFFVAAALGWPGAGALLALRLM